MEDAERTSLLDQLHYSRDAFLAAASGLHEAQAKFKPAENAWSIENIAEHVAVTEHGMYRLITAYSEACDIPADPAREERIARVAVDRKKPSEAPDRVRPRGRYPSLPQALEQFAANRDRTISLIESTREDLRTRAVNHAAAGRITCHECLLVMIAHPLRHADQIREIRAHAGFPA